DYCCQSYDDTLNAYIF
nr:immunoglobulin light chain junction region [Macaca mulatta]